MDMDAVGKSIQKTNRVVVVYEDNLTYGPGAEIAALIADQFFETLDAPVRRVASKDSHVGFSPYLENAILPQSEEIVRVAQEQLEY